MYGIIHQRLILLPSLRVLVLQVAGLPQRGGPSLQAELRGLEALRPVRREPMELLFILICVWQDLEGAGQVHYQLELYLCTNKLLILYFSYLLYYTNFKDSPYNQYLLAFGAHTRHYHQEHKKWPSLGITN